MQIPTKLQELTSRARSKEYSKRLVVEKRARSTYNFTFVAFRGDSISPISENSYSPTPPFLEGIIWSLGQQALFTHADGLPCCHEACLAGNTEDFHSSCSWEAAVVAPAAPQNLPVIDT